MGLRSGYLYGIYWAGVTGHLINCGNCDSGRLTAVCRQTSSPCRIASLLRSNRANSPADTPSNPGSDGGVGFSGLCWVGAQELMTRLLGEVLSRRGKAGFGAVLISLLLGLILLIGFSGRNWRG